MSTRVHAMPFGATLAGGVRLGLWAPGARRVDLLTVLQDKHG